MSRFSLETHKAFVEAHKPPQPVADLNATELGAISVDVRRCRYNALVEQDAYDLPVFSPCDDIHPCTQELGDYHWVDID